MTVFPTHGSPENADVFTDGNHSAPQEAPPNYTYYDYTNYAPTTGLLPSLNSDNANENLGRRRSYGISSSRQSLMPDYGQNVGIETIPYVAINGDVPVSEQEVVMDRRPLTLVTAMVMLVVCANRLHSLVMSQYLYQHFAKSIFGNESVDTSSHPCFNSSDGVSSKTSEADLINQVQELASGMSLKLDLTSYGIGILANLLLGTFSSVMSRKLLLLIPTTGYLIRCSVVPVVVHWDLDITWFYLGYSIDGICGNNCGILLGTFLYTSDVTPRDPKRTLGITIVETVKGAVGAAFYIITGQLIEKTGFIIPSCIAAGIQLSAVLMICILPDRKPILSEKQREQVRSVKGALVHMFSPFLSQKDKRVTWMISLAAAAFFLCVVVRLGIDTVQNLYVMNLPFCFDAITIGWFLFARDLIQSLIMIPSVIFLFQHLPGMLLGIAGVLCMIAYSCVYAFAQYNWEILYVVTGLGLAQNLPFGIIRGESSRLFGSDYQGPLFASFAVVESISYASGTPIFLSIYKATLSFFTGFVFLVGAGMMLVVFVIMCIYQGLWIGHIRRIQYNTLTVSPSVPSDESE